ncbi:hypothetical protein CTI14_63545, partial [Methylobacterium radiotolerans]
RMHEDIDLALHLAGRGLSIGYSPSMVTGISSRSSTTRRGTRLLRDPVQPDLARRARTNTTACTRTSISHSTWRVAA